MELYFALLISFVLQLLGLFFFYSGFFLTRVELPDKGLCHAPKDLLTTLNALNIPGAEEIDVAARIFQHDSECLEMQNKLDKVILIVIDALRYDFAAWDDEKPGLAYSNHLPFIHELLVNHLERSLLFHFEADPPTTTMQRIKGFTTGGLPTFIEFKDDFSKDIFITEDNFIKQMRNKGKRFVVMGDDTWLSLYPQNYFERAYPFPSFDVKDIDSVDNGVLSNIFDEVRMGEYDVLIAHFLGVDHVGHSFGPLDKHMSAKLEQMNLFLEKLVKENLDTSSEEKIGLFVFGDHGMDETGRSLSILLSFR